MWKLLHMVQSNLNVLHIVFETKDSIMRNAIMFCALIAIAGCKKEEPAVDKYFIFGKAYGECGGNCATFFKVQEGNVYADDMLYYTGQVSFSNVPLAPSKYVLAKHLADSFPSYLYAHPDTTFGCPDCHDQGGLYLKREINGSIQYWNIDTDTAYQPLAIRAYVQQVFATIDSLD